MIAEIVARHEPGPCADAIARWWDRHPESFAVARDPAGDVGAFVQILEPATSTRPCWPRTR